MQSSQLFDEKSIPSWLEEVNDELDSAIKRLDAMHTALQLVTESREKNYFSNGVFQVYINKKEEFNQVSVELLSAKERLEKINRLNQQGYVERIAEYKDWLHRLENDKQNLLKKLIVWREQAHANHMASRRIPLMLDEKLKSKNASELRALCGLTEDLVLLEQAVELEKDWRQYNILHDNFIQHGTDKLQHINEANFNALLDRADTLCREYMHVAEWLTKESKAAYDAIELDNDIIKAEIKVVSAEINVVLAEFRLELAKAGEYFSLKVCRDLGKKYGKMKKIIEEARGVAHTLRDKGKPIQARYAETALRFGDYPCQRVSGVSKQTRKLEDQIDEVEMYAAPIEGKIKEFRGLAVRGDLLNLLSQAIEKNVLFWHQQLDNFWGSNAKINGVSVPVGIALIYAELKNFDSEKNSTESVLKKIARIADTRVSKGIGFFAKRNVNTTQEFYQIIKNSIETLGLLTEEKLQGIQKELCSLKDVKNNGLCGLEFEHDSNEPTHAMLRYT